MSASTPCPSATPNSLPCHTPRLVRFDHVYYAASQLVQVFLEIMSCRHTGALTINFSQGTPSGELEWRQKNKLVDQSPAPVVPSE